MTHNTTEQQTTRLLLIRHAESVANVEGRMQGSGNDPLTPRGIAQAQNLARRMQADSLSDGLIFCSPLQRAMQTAEIVAQALNLPVQVHPGLTEIDLGKLEGVSAEELNKVVRADAFADYDAELPYDFAQRVVATFSALLADYGGQPLVIVTHLGVVCNALAYWLESDMAHAWQHYGAIDNTGISELLFSDGGVRLICHNDARHLTPTSTP
jgi:probable phosphoglycerate mutase